MLSVALSAAAEVPDSHGATLLRAAADACGLAGSTGMQLQAASAARCAVGFQSASAALARNAKGIILHEECTQLFE